MKALTKQEINTLIEENNSCEFVKYFKEKDAELRNILNADSDIYKLFNVDLKNAVDNASGMIVDTFKNAEEMLNMLINFTEIFDVEPGVEFKNDLFKNYILKVSKTNKLIILYKITYSDTGTKICRTDTLTPVRLYMLINNYTNKEMAVEKMMDELGMKVEGPEMLLKNNERLKYGTNLVEIININRYANLYRILKDNLFILQQIQLFGLNTTYKMHASIRKFDRDMIPLLLTSSYLRENIKVVADQIIVKEEGKEVKIISEGHIRKVMVLLQNLGLVEHIEDIDPMFYNCIDKTNIYYKKIKFYAVPLYSNDVLKEADRRAKKLMEHDIFVSNVTNKKCQEILFGKEEDKEPKEKEYLDLENLSIDFTI